MSSSTSTSIERYGLTEVYSCGSPAADVVFVHGLNGDPERTWTSQATGKFWPRDLLPDVLDDRARVLVYGYDADVVAWGGSGGVGKDMIHNHAERLVATLVANRRRQHAEERPLIFVAHSLGGLVVKRALVYSSEVRVGTRTERLRSVFLSTYGILFLGTPHHGSDIAFWGSYLEKIAGVVLPRRFVDSAPQLVDALKSNSETLINIDRQFSSIMALFHLYFFHEAKKTDVKGTLAYIVEEDSAAPTLPDVERSSIPADHSHMCKFDSVRSPGYDLVADAVSYYVEEAEKSRDIGSRWVHEKKVRQLGQGRLLSEGYGSPQPEISEPSSRGSSPAPTAGSSIKLLPSGETSYVRLPQMIEGAPAESFFFVPSGFRANSFFVGMKKQLAELDEYLFENQARDQGTAAVVLHGPPGSGKSHLARQYLYKYRSKFRGGIFWINARYYPEMCKDLWQIAQKFVAKDSPGIRIEPSGNGREYISAVREWFQSRSNWLIILDGVSVDNQVQAEELQKMIPDSKNSSLIYTSRSSQIHANQRLLRPHPIRVPRLSDRDGQELMFKEINIKKTKSNEKAALELVKKVGGLPLAIHAMSVRLTETHEPLEKYSPSSYANDPMIGVPYHDILQGLRKHAEAYNLMNILAFFGPHIPVELLILGLRALHNQDGQVEVRSKASQHEPPDINTSFSILMRNALVERNEPDDTESVASSRSSLLEPEPIDILRLHVVVQKFCRDRLSSERQLQTWLSLAWRVCLRSYQEAKLKMDERDDPPRVSDFREYLIHVQQIRDHTIEHEHRHKENLQNLRVETEQLISEIQNEIGHREPSSSQESVIRHYAVSIFDRTSSISSTDEPPITPGYKLPSLAPPGPGETVWGTVNHEAPVDSPAEIRVMEMLRSLSSNTAPSDQVLVDDHDFRKESQHHRTGSKPGFAQGQFTVAPPSGAWTQLHNDHAAGAMVSRPMDREGNISGSSKAVSGLTEIYRNSPPPGRGGAFVSSRKPTPPAQETFTPPPSSLRSSRPSFTRTISVRRPAEPKLTRYVPNPMAPDFIPSSWPGYTNIDRVVAYPSAPAAWQNWNVANQPNANQQYSEFPPAQAQVQIPYYQVRPDTRNTSVDSNFTTGSGSGLQADAAAAYHAHHGRASSVPDIPIQQIQGMWPRGYGAQSVSNVLSGPSYAANMSRENSSQSRSSSSGITAFRPPSIPPQMTSSFVMPTHPLAQVSNSPLPMQSPQGHIPHSSPLQSVQLVERSPGSISPITVGQVSYQASPVLGTTTVGQSIRTVVEQGGFHSAPATTVFPPPPPGTLIPYTPSPLPAAPSTVQLPYDGPLSGSSPTAQSMSRGSSGQGPGLMVAAPGYGLGIAEFGNPAAIRFGQQEPIDLIEAQTRAEAQRRYLEQEQQRSIEIEAARRRMAMRRDVNGQAFGISSDILPVGASYNWRASNATVMGVPQVVGPAPYPDVNLIPSNSDNMALQAMMNQHPPQPSVLTQSAIPQDSALLTRNRSRGFSEPTRDG